MGTHRISYKQRVISKPFIALYGNIPIQRGYCKECRTFSFIKNGVFVYCGHPVNQEPNKFHRESEPPQGRKTPPKAEKEKILREQGFRCFYCDVLLNSIRYRNGKALHILINWDHQLPFVFSQNNACSNFVAACNICNGLKSNRVFRTIEEAQIYLANKRRQKGYDF